MTGVPTHKSSSAGPKIIFLHGYCEAGWIWQEIISGLQNTFTCLAPDLPGFGSNVQLPEEKTIESVAEVVWRELDQNQISDAVLIGHSLGGYVALAMAESRPRAIRGLGLIHSTPFADTPEKKVNRDKVVAFVQNHGSRLFLDQFASGLFYEKNAEQIKSFRKKIDSTSLESIIHYAVAMRDRPDRSAVIREMKVPVLTVCGRYDTILPFEICDQISALNNAVESHVLESSAHAGMLEERNQTIQIIKEFTEKCL